MSRAGEIDRRRRQAVASAVGAKNSTSDGAGIRDKIRPRRNVWEGRLPIVFDGDSSDEKRNEKIHSVAVNGHQTAKRHTPTNQKTASVTWGGVLMRCDHGGTYGGTISRRLGRHEATKN